MSKPRIATIAAAVAAAFVLTGAAALPNPGPKPTPSQTATVAPAPSTATLGQLRPNGHAAPHSRLLPKLAPAPHFGR